MLEGLKKQFLSGSAWNDFQNNTELPMRELCSLRQSLKQAA